MSSKKGAPLGALILHHQAGYRKHPTLPVFMRCCALGLGKKVKILLELSPLEGFPPPASSDQLKPSKDGVIEWWTDQELKAELIALVIRHGKDLAAYHRIWLDYHGDLHQD